MRQQQQNKDVLKHLQTFNFITPKIARDQYAIERVASVVHRLKNGRLGGVEYNIAIADNSTLRYRLYATSPPSSS